MSFSPQRSRGGGSVEEKSTNISSKSSKANGGCCCASLSRRWVILFLACAIPAGSHVVRKSLGPLKTAFLADKKWSMNNEKFAMLLSATALPNLIVPVFGGAFLDVKGSQMGTLVFLLITLLGQVLLQLAGMQPNLTINIHIGKKPNYSPTGNCFLMHKTICLKK